MTELNCYLRTKKYNLPDIIIAVIVGIGSYVYVQTGRCLSCCVMKISQIRLSNITKPNLSCHYKFVISLNRDDLI